MKVLVTGSAGFIGFHTALRLIARSDTVIGIDNVNDYYDPTLKEARLAELERVATEKGADYTFIRGDLADQETVDRCFADHAPERVIHLAAQAGVRHSIEAPRDYVKSNIDAFTNILEACRHAATPHLTYASTSSVYGANRKMPFSEHDGVDHPLQFYAATKRANELMAHAYSNLFRSQPPTPTGMPWRLIPRHPPRLTASLISETHLPCRSSSTSAPSRPPPTARLRSTFCPFNRATFRTPQPTSPNWSMP
jgi:UDP-glucuronate 4-epimerase